MPKIAGTKNTTPEIRSLVYQRAKENIPHDEIAAFFNITTQTVHRILQRHEVWGHHNDAQRSGRPHKLDDRTLRHIKITLDGNRCQSLSDITHVVNESISSPVHPDTVQRAIRTQLGLNQYVAAKKPFLKPSHIKARLDWAREHKGWTEEDWKHVIWTDESSVEIGKGSKVVWVWRKPGERYSNKCLTPTFKSGRQSLMIWGCMAHGRLGPLICIPKEERTGGDYVRLVLSGPLWDFYTELYEQRGVMAVMEDGAPVHRSAVAKQFHTTHKLEQLPHPAQSPDLNPIEHVWKYLKVRINERPNIPKDLDKLWEALQEEWEKIDIEFINSLVKSMPDRAQAVYMAHGGHTKY